MNLPALEESLVKACELALAKGLKLVPGEFGLDDIEGRYVCAGSCCPIGAWALSDECSGHQPNNDFWDQLTVKFEVGEWSKLWALTHGFDDNGLGEDDDPELYAIGVRLRQRFVPSNFVVSA